MGMAAADQHEVGHQGNWGALHGLALAEAARLSKGRRIFAGAIAGPGPLGQIATMSQRPRITITQSQRLQLNLGLQTSIRLLRADAAGLTRYLEDVAAENPALRLDPPPPPAEWLPRWSRVFAARAEGPSEQQAAGSSLMAHVLAFIDRKLADPAARAIALALAEALEPTGWLSDPPAVLAARLKVEPRAVDAVLRHLQAIEPPGLFARDLADCLRLQAKDDGIYDRTMALMLSRLDLLASGDLDRLAELAKVSPAEIARRFRLIRAMNPKPGSDFDALAAPRLREPDLLARRGLSGDWEVTLNRSSLPALRLVDPGSGGAAALAAARQVQRMVEARNSSLLRVGREILQRQILALDQGAGALVPMTMAEVAARVEMHESTVSRVVAGTSVDTPLGTWWLRRLFSRGLGEGQVAGAALRDRLARLVEGEDRLAPLTDAALAGLLSRDGAVVARRTIAKYRGLLRIPPAHRRRLR